MIARLARRSALGAVTLILATALLYAAIRMVPGTPWAEDPSTPPEQIQEWAARHHLDRPLPEGYLMWLGDVARGDLGDSYAVARGEPVSRMILQAAPTSLVLGLLGFGAALAASISLGFAAARRPGGAWDRSWSITLYALSAAPSFWIAAFLQDLFAVRWKCLPLLGAGPIDQPEAGILASIAIRAPYWILPPICLALGSMAFLFRFMRAGLLEAVESPSVRAARARGIPLRLLICRHAFAGTRVHLVTLLGILAPAAIGGSVIIESIFALPGIGRLFFQAVSTRDYPVVMGVGLVMALASVFASALADLLYLAVEPRLRGGHEAPR